MHYLCHSLFHLLLCLFLCTLLYARVPRICPWLVQLSVSPKMPVHMNSQPVIVRIFSRQFARSDSITSNFLFFERSPSILLIKIRWLITTLSNTCLKGLYVQGNMEIAQQSNMYVIYNYKCITIHSIYLLFFELSYITCTSDSRILDNHITIEKQSREMHLRVFKRVLLPWLELRNL